MNTWSVNRLAARAVALHGPGTPHERRELLEMLGLVDDADRITPDDARTYDLADLNEDVVPTTEDNKIRAPKRDRSHVPAGLANLTPAPKPERKRPAGQPKAARPPCGTLAGRASHLRHGEPLCRECKDAQNAYQRERKQKRKRADLPAPQQDQTSGEVRSA